jgi:hypothetical protein
MDLLLSLLYNLFVAGVIVFVIAFALTKMLNPTATTAEIFGHWKKTYLKNCEKGVDKP